MKKIVSLCWKNSADRNIGFLVLRVFLGLGLLTHGLPKLAAGPERWEGLGQVVTGIGVPGPAVFWGFMSAFAESIGAIFLVLGLLTPLMALLIVINMSVAVFVAHSGDPFAGREMALLYLFGSLMFMLKGAGHYAVDRFLPR